jgi:hypothetical protein
LAEIFYVLEEPAASIFKVEDMHPSVVKIDAAGSSKTRNVVIIPEDNNHTIIVRQF